MSEKSITQQIAEEICSVQPMDGNLIKNLYDSSMTTEKLIEDGYKPVSKIGLLWIKDNE